jgi:uncharacterized protein YbaR (Trm112 family)
MKNDYFCPACSNQLNVNNNIVLTVQRKNGDAGIVFLDTKLGNYSKVKSSSLIFEKDEVVRIFCPICKKDLLCMPDKNLARLNMKDDGGEIVTVLFSVKYGEESTYLVQDKKLKEKFGKHADPAINFETLSGCK